MQAAAAVDPAVGLAFLRVANTVDLPDKLLRPSVALRVLRAGKAGGRAGPAGGTPRRPRRSRGPGRGGRRCRAAVRG